MYKILIAAVAISVPTLTVAASVSPISYSYITTPNHSFAYKDDTYNGTLGELTDGVSATGDWQATDGGGAAGPNVGWESINPIIEFNFDKAYDFLNLGSRLIDL